MAEVVPIKVPVQADLRSDPSVLEILARTPSSRFVVAKRARTTPLSKDTEEKATGNGSELYMLVGRKDASLTDAERESLLHADEHCDDRPPDRCRERRCEAEAGVCNMTIDVTKIPCIYR